MRVYRLEYAGEYIDTYATDTLARLKIASDMLSEQCRVESPEIIWIDVVMDEDEVLEDERTEDEALKRKDLGFIIVDDDGDTWYRQVTGAYRIYFTDAGDWGSRLLTADEIRDAYGIQEEVPWWAK